MRAGPPQESTGAWSLLPLQCWATTKRAAISWTVGIWRGASRVPLVSRTQRGSPHGGKAQDSAILGTGLSPRSIFPYAWTFVRLSFIVGGPEDEMAYDKVWKRFCEFSSPRRAHVYVGSSIYLMPFPPQA